MRVAINGFGRIGRAAFKAMIGPNSWGRARRSPRLTPFDFEMVAINDLTDTQTLAYLLKYDTVYGIFPADCGYDDKHIIIDKQKFPVFAEKDPTNLPWQKLDVDVVIESTGLFTEHSDAAKHLAAGAKKVLISANSKDTDISIVLGVNENQYDSLEHNIVDNCSCTTNAAAPVMKILHEKFVVKKAYMTTVHAVTATQSLVDSPNKSLRRSRAAFGSIIPEPTGAAEAVVRVLPELEGHITGSAYRVPVLCGSIVEVVATVAKETNTKEVNQIFQKAARDSNYKNLIAVSDEELVSADILGSNASAIVDLQLTETIDFPKIKDENMVRVAAWYDNEWAYANRLVELANLIGKI